MQRLIGYGLRLASQLPVPGAVPDDGAAPSDVSITLDPPEPTAGAPIYLPTPDGLCFVCPSVATYRIAADSIGVAPDPDATIDMVASMLIATALPALLWLRGGLVLHAAAAQLAGGGALAIAGGTGSGKSTILAQLVRAGGLSIGDDTIVFDAASGREASGLGGGWFVGGDGRGERRFEPSAPGRSRIFAPIAAILVLDTRTQGPGDAVRLDPVAAVTHLLASLHRPRVSTLLGRAGKTLRHATLLAAAIPLYSWRRRAGAAALTPAEWRMLESIGTGGEIE